MSKYSIQKEYQKKIKSFIYYNQRYYNENISEISVASGVVVDSNSRHEFNENYIKAKSLLDLFN